MSQMLALLALATPTVGTGHEGCVDVRLSGHRCEYDGKLSLAAVNASLQDLTHPQKALDWLKASAPSRDPNHHGAQWGSKFCQSGKSFFFVGILFSN